MNEDKLYEAFQKIRNDMDFFHQEIEGLKRTLEQLQQQTQQLIKQTNRQEIPTHQYHSETFSTGNKGVSTGNQGVPTDRQTNQQTDRHIKKFALNQENNRISQLQRASEILESLDDLKKEVRFKFKRLTNQEMLIYSTIYQLEEQGLTPDYAVISEKLKLSESSVRDYIGKITKKGIPLDKIKEGNKKITLKIPQDLKKIASLNTIIQLREL